MTDRRSDEIDDEQVIAWLEPFVSPERQRRIADVLARRLASVAVVLENVYDPHNGAACLRSTEAFGLQAVHVVPGPSGFPVAQKVTQGADRWLDVTRHGSIEACYAALHTAGFRVAAALPGAPLALETLPVDAPLALVFGNEHEGLSAAAQAGADLAFQIPHLGFVQSLNLSVACAVSVHTTAARRRAHLGAPGDLGAAHRRSLQARWYRQSVEAASEILARRLAEAGRGPGTGDTP